MKRALMVTTLLVVITAFSGIAGATEVNEVNTVEEEVKIMGLPYVPA